MISVIVLMLDNINSYSAESGLYFIHSDFYLLKYYCPIKVSVRNSAESGLYFIYPDFYLLKYYRPIKNYE